MNWNVFKLKNRTQRMTAAVVSVPLLLAVATVRWQDRQDGYDTVLLLRPRDAGGQAAAVLRAWSDALAEEGYQATPIDADDVERRGLPGEPAGVILPDSALQDLGDKTVAELYRYARDGGHVLVGFDAGTPQAGDGASAARRSRLSDLVGVTYAERRNERDTMLGKDRLIVTPAGIEALAIQPGKLQPTPSGLELKAYGREALSYPFIATSGDAQGEVLAHAAGGGAMVLRRPFGDGQVLFVNLPVGELKTRSDGYLLHQGIRLFMRGMVGAPQLLPVPDGIGGMVLNVQVDTGEPTRPLGDLEEHGLFRHGPFSLHVASSDHDAWMKDFIRRMARLGHEVGDHVGWSPERSGRHDEAGVDGLASALDLNHRSLEKALGRPPRVYSAPQGRQPAWTDAWLERHGFKAYYASGDSGPGPTHAWRDGRRTDGALWAFPVANFKAAATFEDFEADGLPHDSEIAEHHHFVLKLIDFVAEQRVARLTYFHAAPARRHLDTVDAWMAHADELQRGGRFRWYRMEDLAAFMSRREQAQWSWNGHSLQASHPQTLKGLTWRLPRQQADAMLVRKGRAELVQDGPDVLVRADDGQQLRVGPR